MSEQKNQTTTIPTTLARDLTALVNIETKRDDAIGKAHATSAHDLIKRAPAFAAHWDKFATDRGLVSKAGNVVDTRVAAALVEAGQTMPTQSTWQRALQIGRLTVTGQEEATWTEYTEAQTTQPSEAVAPGEEAKIARNPQTIKDLAAWLSYKNGPSDAKVRKTNVLVDDVLMTNAAHAEWVKPYTEPEAEAEDQDQDQDQDSTPPVEPSEEYPEPNEAGAMPETITNVVNVGALAAVFAKCDNETVEASMVYDVSDYESRDDLLALALSALAAVTIMDREEALTNA